MINHSNKVSDEIGKNRSYIYQPDCIEICPEACPYGNESPWKIAIKEVKWDIDPKLKATCGKGNNFLR